MNKRGLGCIALIAVISCCAFVVFGRDTSEYFETRCVVWEDNSFAIIGMKKKPGFLDKSPREYDIQFGPDGLVVRFPPIYYAPSWRVTSVIYQRLGQDGKSGLLKLRQPGLLGIRSEHAIGVVSRKCWTKVSDYIHEYVDTKSSKVKFYERP
jgi:hypothetical protein